MPRKTIGERLRQKRQSSSSGASTSKRRKSTLKDNQRKDSIHVKSIW